MRHHLSLMGATLGDPPGYQDDANYTGDTGLDPTSMQYYRNQITAFQLQLNALDNAYNAIGALYAIDELPPEILAQCDYLVTKYESNMGTIKAVAQGLNLAADGLNAIGVRFPVLSIPTTLNLAPAVLGAGMIAALAAIASATYLIKEWIDESQSTAKLAATVVNLSPAAQQQVANALIQSNQAVATVNGSLSSNISNTAKYIAIGAVAIVGLMLVMDTGGSRSIIHRHYRKLVK